MKTNSCFIIGLPEAGKTTFLAALWFSISERTHTSKLTLERLTGDNKYLTEIRDKWLGFELVSRTAFEQQQEKLSILLKDESDELFEMNFTDLSGEEFINQYKNREIKKETYEFILNTNNFLLLINPLTLAEPVLINSISVENRDGVDELISRNPSDDPTAVQLVELLQFVQEILENKNCNINIIVSAWDMVTEEYDNPEVYVKCKLPFLWQYVYSNSDLWNVKYFGVSAQGGNIDENHPGEKLAEQFKSPIERIFVIDNSGNTSNDITLPIYHLFNKENGGENDDN